MLYVNVAKGQFFNAWREDTKVRTQNQFMQYINILLGPGPNRKG